MPDKSEKSKKRDENSPLPPGRENKVRKRDNQHVVRRENGWAVRGAGNSRDTVKAPTQKEAIERAREIARPAGSEVIIHGRDGKIVGKEVFRKSDWELEPYRAKVKSKQSSQAGSNLSLSKYIDKQYYGKRPHIRGRRLLVSMIAANERANHWNNQQLAEEFGLSEEEVLVALLYYRQHKSEIDRQDAEAQEVFDEMYRLHGEHHE